MKPLVLILSFIFILIRSGSAQVKQENDNRILFRGLVIDATNFSPISNSQILINNEFSSLSGTDGTFSFIVSRKDTVTFSSLGYKRSVLIISDTLHGEEFVTGVFLNSDTVSIGEVVILPGYRNLKADIMNAKSSEPDYMSNARYNVAVSAYQGKNSTSVMGDPLENYAVINQRQKTDAFEKGGIPSNNMVGLNALLFLPAVAYMYLHKPPEAVAPMPSHLSDKEIEQVQKMYLDRHRKKP
jgi:hypothetical protein